ncbi:hypothetical protein PWT90_01213 [Aphanocladium album]|nr:hypothetical protein PWT90_01213 [Aphanocladium album]
MAFTACVDDSSLGPAVRGCRDGFDFTLKFEQIFFSILPSSLFMILCILRLFVLVRRQCIVDGTGFQLTKAGAFVVLAAVRFASMALAVSTKYSPRTFVIATALDALTPLSMAALSFFEHSRSPRPSVLLSLYIALKILFDIAQSRTLWLASQSNDELIFTKLFIAATALWIIVAALEAVRKRRWIRWNLADHSPEETVGIYELMTYSWSFRLLQKGRRNILSAQDLYKLDTRVSAKALHSAVENLNISQFGGKKHALAKSLFRVLMTPILMPVLPVLCTVGLGLCEPLLVQRLVNYLDSTGTRSSNVGYGLIGAAIIIYSGNPLSNSVASYYMTRFPLMMRSVLIKAVYQKTTTAQCSAEAGSKALTLMGSDVEKIRFGFDALHTLWSVPLQVAVTCWLLYRQLGAAFAAPIVLIICLSLANALLMRWAGPLQNAWMEKIQSRVGKTNSVIANMKSIKMSGLAPSIESSIHSMRIEEMKAAGKFRALEVMIMVTSFAPGSLGAMFTFAVTSRNLDVTTLFTSVALLELLSNPLNSLFQTVPRIISAFVCIQRIQDFLESKDRIDFRQMQTYENQETSDRSESPRIQLSNGNFGWEPERMILRDINASIFAGLNIVVGPVASGKSTLCKVLLGETPFAKGTVNFLIQPRKTAFCDQVPCLFNATIKENIVGFGDFDRERYEKVIRATMLASDLAVLPNGDETKIGSNGITLSGGQKQRVSIARAIYEECDFYIFDDVLSGLDNDTAQHVFKQVFGSSGILQQRNATVILCTHAVHYLPEAAHIIALGTDGTVREQGSFKDLIVNQKYVQGLNVRKNTLDGEEIPMTSAAPESSADVVIKSIKAKPDEPLEDASRASGELSVFLHYFRSIGKLSVVAFTFSGVLCGFGCNFPNAWLAMWSDDASNRPQAHSKSFYLGVFSFLSCLRLATVILEVGLGSLVLAKLSGLNLHKDAIRTVIAAPLRFFVKTDVGKITNLFSQDLSLIDNELPSALIDAASMFWIVVGSSALAAVSSPYLLISYPFIIAAAYLLQRFYLLTSRQLRLIDLEAKSPLYTHFTDTMKNIATFRAFGWTNKSIAKSNALLDSSTAPAYQLSVVQRWLLTALRLLMSLIAVGVVVLATQLKASAGFAGANTGVEDLPGEDIIPPESWPEKGTIEIADISASYSSSSSTNVSENSCSEKTGDDVIYALRNINLIIESGQKVAICGRTGSGKSSFILMLLRLLDPFPAADLKLAIDGLSLTEISRQVLRERVIAVPQEPVFFPNGTSFSINLDPRLESTEEECRMALEAVELWTFVSERGGLQAGLSPETLSLGQKQLFSLARAILRKHVRIRKRVADDKNPTSNADASCQELKSTHSTLPQQQDQGGLLILDEYSSSLDNATDRMIQNIVLEEFKYYTIVMVSHRLEMVMEFDKVVVLDAGSIVEDGPPKKLADKQGSRFRDLWMARNST